ncbi:Uncharacterised protein [uncultured archaeon]|nr:Uncharacterised protein [uncultured archaeon]
MKTAQTDKGIKALAMVLLIILLYFVFLYAGKTILVPGGTLGNHMMNFSTPETGILNAYAIALAIAAGAVVFLILREEETKEKIKVQDTDIEVIKKAMAEIAKGTPSKDKELGVIKKALAELLKEKFERQIPPEQELKIIKKALTEEEKKAIAEIEKAGEITQDSLRFRLGWSKAKASAIISNLDRMGIVQRERQGKTYKVFLQKSAKG